MTDQETTNRPAKRVSELAGVLKPYARPDGDEDWDRVREQTERAVAEEVARRGTRRRATPGARTPQRPPRTRP